MLRKFLKFLKFSFKNVGLMVKNKAQTIQTNIRRAVFSDFKIVYREN